MNGVVPPAVVSADASGRPSLSFLATGHCLLTTVWSIAPGDHPVGHAVRVDTQVLVLSRQVRVGGRPIDLVRASSRNRNSVGIGVGLLDHELVPGLHACRCGERERPRGSRRDGDERLLGSRGRGRCQGCVDRSDRPVELARGGDLRKYGRGRTTPLLDRSGLRCESIGDDTRCAEQPGLRHGVRQLAGFPVTSRLKPAPS